MGAVHAKDQRPVHGRGQREPQAQEESTTRAAATSTDASTAAAAQGGAAVERLTHQQRGDRGRSTDGSSTAAAAVDRRGKKPISASDDREQARRKSDPPKDKLLGSSMRAHQSHAEKKLLDKKREQPNCPSQNSKASMPKSVPHVYHKKIPMGDALQYYFRDINHAFQRPEVGLRLKFLDSHYSEFRPVVPDGDSFFRSFIFSYLEQIINKVDTHREDRLLAAVRALASQAEHVRWASLFSQKRKPFEMLIEKIKGWKRMLEYPTSRASYNKGEFLLEFFSSYDTTDDIFAFLRLVAATWMCTHRGTYERRVKLEEGRGMEDWCSTLVIPPRVQVYWVVIRALAEALGVAIRMENVNDGTSHNTHYNIVRGTPIVTLLHMEDKCDIIYPIYPLPQGGSQHPPGPTAGTSSGDPAAESSSPGAARASCWWFDCCFVVPKKSLSRGSTGSACSSHKVESRPNRTESKQSPI